jgi:hypothetical protein
MIDSIICGTLRTFLASPGGWKKERKERKKGKEKTQDNLQPLTRVG